MQENQCSRYEGFIIKKISEDNIGFQILLTQQSKSWQKYLCPERDILDDPTIEWRNPTGDLLSLVLRNDCCSKLYDETASPSPGAASPSSWSFMTHKLICWIYVRSSPQKPKHCLFSDCVTLSGSVLPFWVRVTLFGAMLSLWCCSASLQLYSQNWTEVSLPNYPSLHCKFTLKFSANYTPKFRLWSSDTLCVCLPTDPQVFLYTFPVEKLMAMI